MSVEALRLETTNEENTIDMRNESYGIIQTGLVKQDIGCYISGVPYVDYRQWSDLSVDRHCRVTLGVNSLLLKIREQLVLIDTGFSAWARDADVMPSTSPDAEHLTQYASQYTLNKRLRDYAVIPREIETVIVTSPHSWQISGLLVQNRGGALKPAFPNADVFISGDLGTDRVESLVTAGVSWEPITADQDVVPGIEAIQVGDTAALKITLGGEKILYLSNICPTHWHLEHPIANPSDDFRRDRTMAAKRKLIEMAIRYGYLCVFANGHQIKAGYPEQRGSHIIVRSIGVAV
jgi:hypothetical protein